MPSVIGLAVMPVVSVRTGVMRYGEILARLSGDRSAGPAVAEAERAATVHWIDLAVLRLTLQRLRAYPGEVLGVNVSVRTIERGCGVYLDALAMHREVAPRLLVEVTESARVRDLPGLMAFADGVRRFGAAVVVDDFGRGHTCSLLVDALAPDLLKTDADLLVDGSRASGSARRVVERYLRAGGEVVCERVGDERTLGIAIGGGAHYVQGFHVAKPRSLPALVVAAG